MLGEKPGVIPSSLPFSVSLSKPIFQLSILILKWNSYFPVILKTEIICEAS